MRAVKVAVVVSFLAVLLGPWCVVGAQDSEEESEEKKRKWTNSTDLSLVLTQGNTNTNTLGFKNNFRYNFEKGKFRLRMSATRRDESDDLFLQADPGFSWVVGDDPPPDITVSLIEPPVEPDVEILFTEGRYDRKFTDRLTWHVGGSWDRNLDAGILSRTIGFAGVARIWWDRDDFHFNTSWGLSRTKRIEENPDPLKDESFSGVRLAWDYLNIWGKNTTYENDFTFNVNVSDVTDWMLDMDQSVAVKINSLLSLKVGLQWLYNNEPALEDVDVIARVDIVDPDGVPGTGDEFFITVDSGGAYVKVGSDRVRKKQLDTIFTTSLVLKF